MASLYKKPVTLTNPKTGERIKTKSKKWWGRYRDENGVERRKPLATDKTAAQAMLNELVKKVELRKAGVVDRFDEHWKRPISEHLVDFGCHLKARRVSTEQVSRDPVRRREWALRRLPRVASHVHHEHGQVRRVTEERTVARPTLNH